MRSRNKIWRGLSSALLLAGVFCLGVWAWSIARQWLFQSRASRAFDQQTAEVRKPSVIPSPAPGSLLGRLTIPRLHLSAMVREGTESGTLGVALGHVPGTALPGLSGNVGIAGHRDTLFRCLRKISKGDLIVFQTAQGSYTYGVEDTAIVKPQDIGVLAPGAGPEITLVTCYPFSYIGSAPDRFIVHAQLLPPPGS